MSKLFRDVKGNMLCPHGSVVCIGAFDGLHIGHQTLISCARARAQALGLPLVALSFEPLPREFFSPETPPTRLSLPRAKFEGLRDLGADQVGLLRFNTTLALMTAEDFIETILLQRLSAREVWVGPDFRFGKGRVGNVALLQEVGARCGFSANEIMPIHIDGERVSSSRLRLQLALGDIDGAARALGQRYSIAGKIVHGSQLGRTLGYPTANIRLAGKRPPLMGIYATWVHGVSDQPLASVSSLGTRPTMKGTEPLLEAHLFDFDGSLYGKRIRIEFVAKLRDEEKFDDFSVLARQMDIDADQARKALRHDIKEMGVSA